jgi:hypothetical protein
MTIRRRRKRLEDEPLRRVGREPALPTAALVAAVCGAALGQPAVVDEGPVVVGERTEGLKWFDLDRLSTSLDFYSRYLRSHQSTSGEEDRTDTELLLRQSIGVSSRFFLGHQNLADVTADFSLGLENNFIDSETQDIEDEHETGLYTLFDINALIVGEGPAPVRLFARRSESQLDRAFVGSIDSTSTEFGGSVSAFRDVAPTTLTYTHRVVEQDDQLGLTDDELTQDTFQLQSLWDPNENHRLTLNYDLEFVDETRARIEGTSFTRHDGILVHRYTFGERRQNDLRSQLQVLDQTGDFAQRRIRLFETLTLRHTDTLETRYDATAESRETGGQDQQFFSGLFTLRHELFDSLVTTFNAGGNHTSLTDDDFTSTELLTGLDFEYNKRVPMGELNVSLGLNFSHQEDSERGGIIRFVDTLQVFPDAGPLLLTGRNIIPDSVVVSDTTSTRIFFEGLDYRQSNFPDRIELRRIIGGPIGPGQPVLVDYDLGPEPEATIETYAVSLATRYTFWEGFAAGLSPYALLRDISQDISPDDPSRIPFDVTTVQVGMDYLIGPFTLNAEYEDQDSSIAPFEAFRASARYERLLGLNSYIRADLSHESIDFGDGGSSVDFQRVLGEWGYAFANGMQISLGALYRNEQDSLAGDSQGFEQTVEFYWRFRQTDIGFSFRNSMLEGDNVNTDSQTAIFEFRRTF